MAEMILDNKSSKNEHNKGFTLVEIIIVLVVLAIVTAIAVPVTLSVIDNSRQDDAKMMAKNIMNAVQTEFNQLAADGELWYSLTNRRGIILNRNRKNRGAGLYDESGGKIEFRSGIMNISDTVACDEILNKIDDEDGNLTMLYVGAGNAYYYEFQSEGENDRKKMYKAYVIVFRMKDDENVYFYDGKEITTEWTFKNPTLETSITKTETYIDYDNTRQSRPYGLTFRLKNNDSILLQLYALKIDENIYCDEYWKKKVLEPLKNS